MPYGSHAMLINFQQKIDPEINSLVTQLAKEIENWPEITFLIPAYCSLTVGFDIRQIDFLQLQDHVRAFFEGLKPEEDHSQKKTFFIPVCYEHDFGPDMEEVMEHTKLTTPEIIQLHTQQDFRTYMLGFLAGFPYLGTVPDPLICGRKKVPRKTVPQGAVGLAGAQTGIYPIEAPGGWQIIGQTPIQIFDPNRSKPALLSAGDFVRFEEISAKEFLRIQELDATGKHELRIEHG